VGCRRLAKATAPGWTSTWAFATAAIGSAGGCGGNISRTFSQRPNVTGVTGQFAKAG
jgi:hypothetical protein